MRVTAELPVTATAKIVKRQLRAERWECADPVWWRPERGAPLRRMTRERCRIPIRRMFEAAGRAPATLDAR